MASDFDEMVNHMQEKIIEEMRKVYSKEVIELFLHPKNVGEIKDAEGYGKFTGPCGDTMEIYLKVKDDRIQDARFMTDGCGTTLSCGSTVTSLCKGKTILEAMHITSKDILHKLNGLPEESIHCSVLAVNTLKKAIKNYFAEGKDSWKRLYKKR
jgi:nitrogen fixation NifU-like protein